MSNPLTVVIPHTLGAAEAKRRIDAGLADLLAKLPGQGGAGVTQNWEGDRMNFAVDAMGQSLTGLLDVRDDAVEMQVVLPGMLSFFGGKIRDEVERKGQKLLAKA